MSDLKSDQRTTDLPPIVVVQERPFVKLGENVRAVVRTFGELLITSGLVLLLFASYEVWGKAVIVAQHQRDLDRQLTQEWGARAPEPPGTRAGREGIGIRPKPRAAPVPEGPPPGWALGRLYIPKLHLHWVVVEGVSLKDLAWAPGHYPGSAQPGQVGNFAMAGHRSPAIFWDLDTLKPGDPIVVETRSRYYIYRVTQNRIVRPTATEVVAPVPDHPGQKPRKAMLTLTTCNPKWDNTQRLIVHAVLVRGERRTEKPPAELKGS